MITLLHGENTTASRNELNRIRQDYVGETVLLDAKETPPERLLQALQSPSLFEAAKRLVILENLYSNKTLLDLLTTSKIDSDLIIWEDKKLTSSQTKSIGEKLPELKATEFPLDPIVFKFVDSLKPNNLKTTISFWSAYKNMEEPEIALAMIVRQFRLLILTKSQASAGPDEWNRLSPWQKQKLSQQATFFTLERLRQIYQKLLEIDYQNKTSQLPGDLPAAIELFLLSL